MENFKYSWCWDCNRASVRVGKQNTCCPYYGGMPASEYHEMRLAQEWSIQNNPPNAPTKEMIMDYLDSFKNMSGDNLIITKVFGMLKYGDIYWPIQQWIDKMKYEDLPSYEDICNHLGYEPIYDCKTGKDWAESEKKDVPDISGWSSLESFESDEIPWREFVRRWKISKGLN